MVTEAATALDGEVYESAKASRLPLGQSMTGGVNGADVTI
jgi:hypothetical protein